MDQEYIERQFSHKGKRYKERVRFVTITPADAQKLLDHKHPNRALNKLNYEAIAADMLCGDWVEGVDPGVIVSTEDRLLDAQNRLSAVVLSGKPITFLFRSGIPPELQVFIDRGTPRTYANHLQIHGFKNPAHLASVHKHLLYIKSDGTWKGTPQRTRRIQIGLDFAKQHDEELQKAINFSKGIIKIVKIGLPALAISYWLESKKGNIEKEEKFWLESKGDYTENPNYPPYRLRKKVEGFRKNIDTEHTTTGSVAIHPHSGLYWHYTSFDKYVRDQPCGENILRTNDIKRRDRIWEQFTTEIRSYL